LNTTGLVQFFNKQQFQLSWPPKNLTNVRRIQPVSKLQGQNFLFKSSSSFLVFHSADYTCQITSWILNFETQHILNGPFSIQVAPNSIYLSSNYYYDRGTLFSINSYKNIGNIDMSIMCSDNSDSLIVLDQNLILLKIVGLKFQTIRILNLIPIQVLSNQTDFLLIGFQGKICEKN
jgi:hypothetical protein